MQNAPLPMSSTTGIPELTSQECIRISRSLSESLDHFGMKVHGSSDLQIMIRELTWMGSFPMPPFSAEGAIGVDQQRALRAFACILQARDIARVLEACRYAKNGASKVRKIRGKLDRLRYQDARAQDTLFELQVAGLLIRAGLDVELSLPPRPDVVCRFNGMAMGLECKRVQNRDRLRERLSKARKQLTKQDLPAAVIIDVQPLLYRTNDPNKPVYLDLVSSHEELRGIQSVRLKKLALSVTGDVEKAFDGGVRAIALCAMTWGLSEQPSAYVCCWIVEPMVPNVGYDIELADAFGAILRALKER